MTRKNVAALTEFTCNPSAQRLYATWGLTAISVTYECLFVGLLETVQFIERTYALINTNMGPV